MANSVPNPVQRLRYFDGEYLRSYDFIDEQTYHIEMRRLINRKLHLYGIIYGLEIVQDEDSVPATSSYFFSIAPGMAIDKSGREIVVPAPYSLSNILDGPGLSLGKYEVWICYQESETGLPAAGYLDCNVKNQNTRWQETFLVQLVPVQRGGVATDCGGVRLGIVKLINPGLGLQIANPVYNIERHYVGIRAQRVIAPDQIDADPDPFDIAVVNEHKLLPGYLDVHPGVFNRGNVIVRENLVVGDDFPLESTEKAPTPPSTGNLKVTGDLLLYGSFFGFNPALGVSGQWCGLQQYIQSMMPDIQTGMWPITIPNPCTSTNSLIDAASQSLTIGQSFTLNSTKLGAVSNTTVMVAISSMGAQDPKDLEASWLGLGITAGFIVQVSATATAANPTTVNVSCVVAPGSPSGPNFIPPVTSLNVSYVVIFYPPNP